MLPANPTPTQRAAEEDDAAAIVQGQFEAPQTQEPEPKQGSEPKLEPKLELEPGPEVEEKAAAEPGEAEAKQAKETTAAAKGVKRPMKLKRFLLRYYPPGIILEYESGGEDFTKPIDLLDLTPDTDVDVLLNQIIRQESLLSEKRKPQLSKLVNMLIDKLEENADHAVGASAKQAEEEPEPEANPKAPLTRFKKTKEEIYAALSQEDKAKADEARGKRAAKNEGALRIAAADGETANPCQMPGASPRPPVGGGCRSAHR